MRANSRVKQGFEVSLDGRQVAAIVAGALVLLGATFVLGMTYGTRAARQPAAVKDPLATLDEPLTAAPPPKDDEALRAHEALTAARPDALPAPAVKPVALGKGELATATATPTPTATANVPVRPERSVAESKGEPASSTPTATSTPNPTATATPRPDPLPAKRAAPKPPRGAYTIQVASVPRRADAEKVAHRFARRAPRIVAADVPGKGRVWRVQVGSYPTRDAASRGLASLGGQGFVTAAR
jgi:DedD protein